MNWESFEPLVDALNRRRWVVGTALLALLALVLLASPMFGQLHLTFGQVYGTVTGMLTGEEVPFNLRRVVWDTRLPVAVTAAVVGFTLGMCGAVMQSVMRNPLADPYTLGVSSGASLGATLFLVGGFSVVPFLDGDLPLMVNAFLFSLIPTAVVVLLSTRMRMTPTTTILAGIAMMYAFGSVSSLMMLYADPTQLSEVYIWNLGTVGKGTWENIPVLAAPMLLCLVVVLFLSRRVDILSMGDDMAHTMGVDPGRLRTAVMAVVSLTVACMVCFTGTIGFIGLVAPHIARCLTDSGCAHLSVTSGLLGALLLVVAECIARVAGALPVGVVTALIGCPLFIFLLLRNHRRQWV